MTQYFMPELVTPQPLMRCGFKEQQNGCTSQKCLKRLTLFASKARVFSGFDEKLFFLQSKQGFLTGFDEKFTKENRFGGFFYAKGLQQKLHTGGPGIRSFKTSFDPLPNKTASQRNGRRSSEKK